MTKKEFLQKVSGSEEDVLGDLLGLLEGLRVPFCVIGGLAVNAYAEPVVSLDLDIVVRSDKLPSLLEALPPAFKTRKFPNSLNLTSPKSDLRIQIQIDPRYQDFIRGARKKDVLGYRLPVARVEDVLQGKVWAALDPTRRPSKRQKDLSDILRLVETRPVLARMVPAVLKKKLDLS
jgi:hypothetical protein